MPSPRFTVRVPDALAAQVQARLHATGATFTALVQEALAAYLADTLPTGMPTPADTRADTPRALQETLEVLTRRVEALEQALIASRQAADTLPTGADSRPPAYDPTRYRLGGLCTHGHNYQGTGKTLRRVPNGACPKCETAAQRERRQRQRDQRQ
jgi:hypothetical protein